MVLLVCCLASFLITSDIAMGNVALPSIVDALSLSATEQQWFVNCYALAFCALPLVAGRLADVFGHRRLFIIGLSVFAVAALTCGMAPSSTVIEIGRAVQGIGGAVLAAATLSLLTTSYPQRTERRRAFAIWSAAVSGSAVIGILLGGVLTSQLSWRWTFFFTALVGSITILVTVLRIAPTQSPNRTRRLDAPGSILITGGLALTVAGLIGVRIPAWSTTLTLILIAGGIGVLALFVRHEHRSADPLLPVDLFMSRSRIAAIAVTAIVGCNLYFLYFAISVFLQRGQHHGPSLAAVLTLPAALSVVAGSLSAPLLSRYLSARSQLLGSMLLLAAGFLWLSALHNGGPYWTSVGLPLIVIGWGLGTSFVPATLLATDGIPADRAGVASGVVNASRQLGRALGLAALSGLVTSALAAPSSPVRIAAAESHAFRICSAIALGGAVAVMALLPKRFDSPGARAALATTVDPVART